MWNVVMLSIVAPTMGDLAIVCPRVLFCDRLRHYLPAFVESYASIKFTTLKTSWSVKK
jgi:hypothetical protein